MFSKGNSAVGGAAGDLEVAEGPGLFTGEQGGIVFDRPGGLRSNTATEADPEEAPSAD